MLNSIIPFIRINRVSTAQISDTLGKTGVIHGVRPITGQLHCVGQVRWIYAYGESNWDFHDQIRSARPGEILLVEAFDCAERAIFGSLVSKFLLLYRQVAAIIVLGNVRDAHHLIKERYPIWSVGITPLGCFNKILDHPFDENLIRERREKYDGSIAVCDDSGVTIIPHTALNQEFLDSLHRIEDQEDIWFDCIDRKKWDTYDTVCKKRYLQEMDEQ
ncbi:MAG TPA: RraA family protein [Methanospirillum sp.]|nr:RraA family protein [Methanospirillum sp.]